MRRFKQSGLYRLMSLVLALTLVFGIFVTTAGIPASAEDPDNTITTTPNLTLKLFADNNGSSFTAYDPSKYASGNIKVEAETVEEFEIAKVYYKKSTDSDWTAATVSDMTSDVPEIDPEATPDQSTPVEITSSFSFIIPPVSNSSASFLYSLKFTNMDMDQDGVDAAYKEHEYANVMTLKQDNVFEVLTAASNMPATGYAKSVKITGNASDTASGIKTMAYKLGSGAELNLPHTNGAFELTLNEEYSGSVTIVAIDNLSNRKETTVSGIQIDATAPTITLNDLTENWAKESVTISGYASDNASGVAKVYCKAVKAGDPVVIDPDNDPVAATSSGAFSYKVKRSDLSNEDGTYNVVFYGEDQAGNRNNVASNAVGVYINFDNQECVLYSLSSDPATYTSGQITVSGTLKDDGAGFDASSTVQFRVTDPDSAASAWKTADKVTLSTDKKELSFKVYFNDKNGTYTKLDKSGDYLLEITAEDRLGNGSTADEALVTAGVYPLTVKVDKTAPVLVADSVQAKYSNGNEVQDDVFTNQPVTVTGRFTEALTEVTKVEVLMGESVVATTTDITASGNPNEYSFSAEIPARTYIGGFTLKAYDASGNNSTDELTSPTLYMDYQTPIAVQSSFTVQPSGWTTAATITGEIGDAASGISGVYYKKSADTEWTQIGADGITGTGDTRCFSFTTAENDNYSGTYDLKIVDNAGAITGSAGNTKEYPAFATVKIDNTAPTVDSVTTAYDGSWTKGNISFTVPTTDPGVVNSGVKRILYSFEDNETYQQNVAITSKDGDGNFTFTIKAATLKRSSGKGGGYVGKIRILAEDNAGNITPTDSGKTVDVKIDTEKGRATMVTSDLEWTNGTRVIQTTFVDDQSNEGYNSGFSKVEYAQDDNVWKLITPAIDGNTYTLTFIAQNYNGAYTVRFYDQAGNISDTINVPAAKQDITVPVVNSVNVSESGWTNGSVTISGTAGDLGITGKENNAGINAIYYKKSNTTEWTQLTTGENSSVTIDATEKTATFSLTIPAESYCGTYDFKCTDNATNESAVVTSAAVQQDNLVPQVSDDFNISVTDWTLGTVTITGTVTDAIDATLANDSGIKEVYYKKSADSTWTKIAVEDVTIDSTTKTASYTFTLAAQNYLGRYDVKCVDNADNTSAPVTVHDNGANTELIKQDITRPTISYTRTEPVSAFNVLLNTVTLGLFNHSDDNELTYTLTLSDNLSGLDLDTLTVTYTDEEGNEQSGKLQDVFTCDVNVTSSNDESAPLAATVTFTVDSDMYMENVRFDIKDRVIDDNTGSNAGDTDIVIVDTVDPTRTVQYSTPVNPSGLSASNLGDNVVTDSDTLYYNGSATLTFTVDEKNFFPAKKLNKEVEPNAVFTVTKDGSAFTDYQLTDWTAGTGDQYQSVLTLTGDGTYQVGLTYTDYSANEMVSFTSATIIIDDTKPTSEVTYSNTTKQRTLDGVDYFQGTQTVTLKITEKNFKAEDVNFNITAKNSEDVDVLSAYSIGGWTEPSTDVHQVQITFANDANFTFDFDYTDLAMNAMDDFDAYAFTVDNEAPVLTAITYSQSIRDVVLETITFGYYNAPVTVEVECFDATSGCYEYNREGILASDASAIHQAIAKYGSNSLEVTQAGAGKATISFTVPESLTESNNFDGFLNILMIDRSKNVMQSKDSTDASLDTDNHRIIVDNIAPVASIETATPVNVVTEGGTTTRYYIGDYKSKIVIEEAHFDSSLVDFKIDGSAYALVWSTEGDTHTADFEITTEGVHSYTLTHKDLSDNEGNTITLENIVIDKTRPVVKVTYDNTNVINSIDGRKYFDKTQSATLTITEANFRSSDVKLMVTATDSSGNTITSPYTQGTWSDDGDVHTLTLNYNKDANLTFDVDYTDLALWQIEDYTPDLFTVDTTAPQTIGFSYSSPVNTKNGKQFYNSNVTVTISCFDATSGVYSFDYEGILAANASSSNAAVVKTAIQNANLTTTGGTSTATFTIPASALSSVNQFDGTVTAVAHDRSGNETTTADDTRLVVDNIAPVATMTVSSPVQTVNGNRYYSGNITVDISITEANFDDATTTFMVDGAAAALSWSTSGDVHTATYTISGDGKHDITLDCTDASNNGMSQLAESNMIIDTKAPEIVISDSLLNQSANNGKKLTFSFSVTDENMSDSGINASLKAVVTAAPADAPEKSIAELQQKEISLGAVSRSGNTFIYTIDNLETDGFYTFTCTATDYANNSSNKLACTGSDKKAATVETFNYSVNRNGSTYWVDSNVENDSYTNSDDIKVALHEINIDLTTKDTKLKVTNDNDTEDIALTGANYVSNDRPAKQIGGGWYESVFTLDNSYFEEDSTYVVVATSHDTAGNINISSENELSVISFTVDRTVPVITSNVSDRQSINATDFDVEFKIAENNLDKNSIDVTINGKPVTYTENTGGSFTCKLSSGELYQDIVINASDLAGNAAETYQVNDITVSTNPFVRWFANKALFFSTLGGGLLVIGLGAFFIIRSRKAKGAKA